MTLEWISLFIFSTIRISTPILFVALCAVVSHKAGLLNLAAESMMLASALTGVIVSALSQNLWIGIFAGAAVSVLVALFLCFAAFIMKVDLYLMSIALNMAMSGATVFVMYLLTGVKSNTAATFKSLQMPNIHIPVIKDIPFIGSIVSGHNGFTYIAIVMIFLVWFLIYRTKLGLRMRVVGENPLAAEAVGINPRVIYTIAFSIAAFIASLGGMYLSMGYQNFFIRDITGGRGFIGMSASNIVNGNPFLSALMSLIFGLAEAVTNNIKIFIADQQLLSSLPYIITVVLIFVMSAIRTYSNRNKLRKQQMMVLNNQGDFEVVQ